jgi:hypothetical protein
LIRGLYSDQSFNCCNSVDNCVREIPGKDAWNINGDGYEICPLKTIDQDDLQTLKWYKFYKDGHLPVSGGLLDQSNFFIELIHYMEKF